MQGKLCDACCFSDIFRITSEDFGDLLTAVVINECSIIFINYCFSCSRPHLAVTELKLVGIKTCPFRS